MVNQVDVYIGVCVCRRQFDLANREAMDESAEWRRMFDSEAEKASKCNTELALVLFL